jgi:hypothetical protein
MLRLASPPWRKQAFTRPIERRVAGQLVCAVVARSYIWTRYTVNTWHINTLTCEVYCCHPHGHKDSRSMCLPVQDTSLYATGRTWGWWSTDAPWPKPCLRARDCTKKGCYAMSHQYSRTVSWWLRLLPTPLCHVGNSKWTNMTQLTRSNMKWKNDAQN